ncbi:MAG TPA: GNAT family N-acetyltransferase, partial [Phycisphaerales bacterium]|nr:GNAT family N-acetyltransferase [Phycisphaerales bacterium]
EDWLKTWRSTREMYPWLVAEEGKEEEHHGDTETQRRSDIEQKSESRKSFGKHARGHVIGFAKAGPHKLRGAYAWSAELSVYIDPPHHGKGVGTKLYEQLFPLLKAQGYMTLIAGVTTPNDASQRLHERFGMKQVACFERVGWKYERWHNVCYFQVMLHDASAKPGAITPVREVIGMLNREAVIAR